MIKRFDRFQENEVMTILCIEVVLIMMGIGLISPILPQYARTFGVNVTMVGLLITVFGVARILVDIPAGRLTDRLGRRPVLIGGPLILVAGSIGCGLADNYWMLLGFRFIQGIGSAMYTTAAMVMLADISTPDNRGTMMSFYQGSLLLGAGLGPTVGGFIAEHFGLAAPFFAFALFALLASLWAYLRLPETHPTLPVSATAVEVGDLGPLPTPPPRGLQALLRDHNFLLISMITFGIFFVRMGAQNQILPLLGADRLCLSEGQIGLALTLVAIIQLITIFIAGRLSDQFGRKAIITPGCVIVAVSLLMLAQSYDYWFLLLSCIVMGVGIGISGPISSAYVTDIIPRESYSIGIGAYRAISDLGSIIGPVLLGLLADIRGFGFSLLFNSLFLFMTAIIFQLMAKEPMQHKNNIIKGAVDVI